jgi:hypothetical protein
LAGQRLKSPEFSDLAFRLAQGGLRRKVLGNGLPRDFLSQLKVRTMPGITGVGAVAASLSAAAYGAGDRTRLEVAPFTDLAEQRGSGLNGGRERIGHGDAS